MLDRMGLSIRNGWLDKKSRVFIYFTLEDAMETMGYGHNKTVKLFADLVQIGLIERKKQGQGRPAKIYVKNFVLPSDAEERPGLEPPQSPPNGETSPKRRLIRLIRIILNGTILSYLSFPLPPRCHRAAGNAVLDKASVPRGKGAILCMRPELSAVDRENFIVPVWMV